MVAATTRRKNSKLDMLKLSLLLLIILDFALRFDGTLRKTLKQTKERVKENDLEGVGRTASK